MASLGLPGLAGFWGEFPAILSSYNPANALPEETFRTFMFVATLGTVLAAGYLLWLLQRTAFGTSRVNPQLAAAGGHGHGGDDHGDDHTDHGEADHGEHEHVHDVHVSEWFAWAPLLALIVALGVYPNIVFKSSDPAVKEVTLQEQCLHDYNEDDCSAVFKPKHADVEAETSKVGE
jgi:NADH-quinone oxidoreductase subunit M